MSSKKYLFNPLVTFAPSVKTIPQIEGTPFTYYISWNDENGTPIHSYYGVRYSKKCHPSDLWTQYFTSSKLVKSYRAVHGEPSVVQVRKIFTDSVSARDWEFSVLTRLKVTKTQKWLNLCTGKGVDVVTSEETVTERYGVSNISKLEEIKKKKTETCMKNFGVEHPGQSEEVRNKSMVTNLERYGVEHPAQNETIHQKMTDTCIERYGVSNPFQSEDVKKKIVSTNLEKYGVSYPAQNPEISKVQRAKRIETMKKKPFVECPHCGKVGKLGGGMTRYHFDNCKLRQ